MWNFSLIIISRKFRLHLDHCKFFKQKSTFFSKLYFRKKSAGLNLTPIILWLIKWVSFWDSQNEEKTDFGRFLTICHRPDGRSDGKKSWTGSLVKTFWFLSNKSHTVIMLHRNHTMKMTPFTSLIQWGHFRPANLEISKSYLKKLFCNLKIFSPTIRQKRPIWPKFDFLTIPSDSGSHFESKNIVFRSITWPWIITWLSLNITEGENFDILWSPCPNHKNW